MARQARVPGSTKYVNETGTRQARIPGGLSGPYMNETSGGAVATTILQIVQYYRRRRIANA